MTGGTAEEHRVGLLTCESNCDLFPDTKTAGAFVSSRSSHAVTDELNEGLGIGIRFLVVIFNIKTLEGIKEW